MSERRKSVGYTLAESDTTRLGRRLQRNGRQSGSYRDWFGTELARVLPWGRGPGKDFTVHLDGVSEAEAEMVLDSVRTRFGMTGTAEETLRHLMETIVYDLIRGGAAMEVEFRQNADDNTQQRAAIHHLPAGSVVYRYGKPIQLVPDENTPLKYKRISYRVLDPATLVVVTLDRQTRRALKDAEPTLASGGELFLSASSLLTSGDTRASAVNMAEFQAAESQLTLRGLRGVGWNARLDNLLEPHLLWRRLQFLRFQFSVRDSIIEAVGEVFAKVGDGFGLTVSLRVENLARVEDVDDAEQHLKDGNRPLTELYRII